MARLRPTALRCVGFQSQGLRVHCPGVPLWPRVFNEFNKNDSTKSRSGIEDHLSRLEQDDYYLSKCRALYLGKLKLVIAEEEEFSRDSDR